MDLSEVSKLDAPAKVLKLSEAIRIGAKKRPQCFGILYQAGATCALGAAAEALGWDLDMHINVRDTFLRDVPDDIWNEVGSRNDSGQRREIIAHWLESKGL